MGQFSHPYMATGKTTALTRWTFTKENIQMENNHIIPCSLAFVEMQIKTIMGGGAKMVEE